MDCKFGNNQNAIKLVEKEGQKVIVLNASS